MESDVHAAASSARSATGDGGAKIDRPTASGANNKISFATPEVQRLAGGIVSVNVVANSPGGEPEALIDGVWRITPASLDAASSKYEFVFMVHESRARELTLAVTVPGGSTETLRIELPADPTYLGRETPHRVLAIGVSHYENERLDTLESAADDAQHFAEAFRAPTTWNLADRDSTYLVDLDSSQLHTTLKDFFGNAKPEEILLLFLAGHGSNDGKPSYLAPRDFDPADPKLKLTPKELWKNYINPSPAKRVIVVVDACGAQGFASSMDQFGADRSTRAVLTSTAQDQSAKEGAAGGDFTGAFLKSLTNPNAVDIEVGGVTLAKAYHQAQGATTYQQPKMEASDALAKLVLATPVALGGSVQSKDGIASNGRSERITVLSYDIKRPRQIQDVSTAGFVEGDTLHLAIKFLGPANWLSVVIRRDGQYESKVSYKQDARDARGEARRWDRWNIVSIDVPLKELKKQRGKYRYEVRACLDRECEPKVKNTFDYSL